MSSTQDKIRVRMSRRLAWASRMALKTVAEDDEDIVYE
jgi:hypothetical protein